MFDLIKAYTETPAVSGNESALRNLILKEISGYCEAEVDKNGNIIAFKKGKKPAKVKLMLDAHMDEIGLIITEITDDGYLRFAKVGGIDNRVLLGRRIKIGSTVGVIGGCPVHLLSADERKQVVTADKMRIDIGAADKQEAEKMVSPGDTAVFDSETTLCGGRITGRSLDDSVGCAILTRLIQSELEYDMYFTFTIGEEVGGRGARTAAYTVAPEAAIVLEATTAADLPESEQKVCILGDGPAISFMDHGAVYDRDYYNAALETAKDKKINCQVKQAVAGGNNSGVIHVSKSGIRTIALSVPCRYLHGPYGVISLSDAENTLALAKALAEKIAGGEI